MKNETVIGGITVAGQPTREELEDVKGGRFGTVVNIRQASEEGNITADSLAGSDVDYHAVPYTSDTVTPAHITAIRDAIAKADGPVLIH